MHYVAQSPELAGETFSLKDILRARQDRQRELRETIKGRRSLVDQLLARPKRSAADGRSLVDQLLARPKRSAADGEPPLPGKPSPSRPRGLKRYEYE